MIPAWMINDLRKRDNDDEELRRVGMYAGSPWVFEEDEDEQEDEDNEDVLEAGGGGDPPREPDPNAQAQARIAEMREQARIDAEKLAAADAKAAAEKAAQIESTRTRTQQAYNSALDYGNQQMIARGLDPMQFGVLDTYRAALDRARGSIPEITSDPASFFGSSLFTDALNQATNTQRRNLRNQFNQFAGDGFANQTFADTADDTYLDAILNEQATDAMDAINRAYARGSINDAGKNYAMNEFNRAKSKGRSTLEDLGLGVLQGYRNQLTNTAKGYGDKINAFELGDTFNMANAQNDLSGLTNRLKGRLEGDIYGAASGSSLFDIDSILGKAGTRSGVMNPGTTGTGGTGTGGTLNNLTNVFSNRSATDDQNQNKQNGVF